MKLAYVAGPYSAYTIERKLSNVLKAQEVAKRLLIRGYVPVVPHRVTELWDHDYRYKDWTHDDWLYKYCFPLLSRCDAIVMVEGWEHSQGANAELEYAKKHGIEVLDD